PAQYPHLRGSEPRQAGSAVRFSFPWRSSLRAACGGTHATGTDAAMTGRRETGPRLGRGLAALLGETAVQTAPPDASSLRRVPLDLLEPNPFQPRSSIDPSALDELAQSIRQRGILQPLVVRPHPEKQDRFQIVAGERRWRAAGVAGLHEVPALVNPMTDTEAA